MYIGWNTLQAHVHYHPNRRDPLTRTASRTLLSNYVNGIPTPIQVQGYHHHPTESSTPLPLLQSTLASLNVATLLPGLERGLIVSATLLVFQVNPMWRTAPSRLELVNPLDTVIWIEGMRGSVTILGRVIGWVIGLSVCLYLSVCYLSFYSFDFYSFFLVIRCFFSHSARSFLRPPENSTSN